MKLWVPPPSTFSALDPGGLGKYRTTRWKPCLEAIRGWGRPTAGPDRQLQQSVIHALRAQKSAW